MEIAARVQEADVYNAREVVDERRHRREFEGPLPAYEEPSSVILHTRRLTKRHCLSYDEQCRCYRNLESETFQTDCWFRPLVLQGCTSVNRIHRFRAFNLSCASNDLSLNILEWWTSTEGKFFSFIFRRNRNAQLVITGGRKIRRRFIPEHKVSNCSLVNVVRR
jgi:hypothetical protein